MLADQNTFKEPLQTLYRMRNVSNDAEIDRLYEDYKKIENFGGIISIKWGKT